MKLNNKELSLIKAINVMTGYFINKNIVCDEEYDIFIEIFRISENILKSGYSTNEDLGYSIIKFYGSETYYNYSIEHGIDKKEALMKRIEYNIYDDDYEEITLLTKDSTYVKCKRDSMNKWVMMKVVK